MLLRLLPIVWCMILLLLGSDIAHAQQCPGITKGLEILQKAQDKYDQHELVDARRLGQSSLEHFNRCGPDAPLPAYLFLMQVEAERGDYEESNSWAAMALEIQQNQLLDVEALRYTSTVMHQQLRAQAFDAQPNAAEETFFSWWQLTLMALFPALIGWWIGRNRLLEIAIAKAKEPKDASSAKEQPHSQKSSPTLVKQEAEEECLSVPLPGLTGREIEVLNLMASGKSNKYISQALYISENTTKSHIANIYGKLEVNNRTEAARKASELNLIS